MVSVGSWHQVNLLLDHEMPVYLGRSGRMVTEQWYLVAPMSVNVLGERGIENRRPSGRTTANWETYFHTQRELACSRE